MDWATDLLRLQTKTLGLNVEHLAEALQISAEDAFAIWEVRSLPTPRQVAAWALWLGEDPYDYAALLAQRDPESCG
jgi:hypothetical protein